MKSALSDSMMIKYAKENPEIRKEIHEGMEADAARQSGDAAGT